MAAASLNNISQTLITPELVQRISRALNQPTEKVQSGLKYIVPAFLLGLAKKGSTSEGALSILNMLRSPNQQNIETVNGVFGNELTTVSTSLGASTDMSSTSVTQMFTMVAPSVLQAVGKKVNQEGLNAKGLKIYLYEQRPALAEIVPTGISNLFGYGSSNPNFGKVAASMEPVPHSAKPFPTTPETTIEPKSRMSWAFIVLLALAVLGGMWWFTKGSHELSAPTMNKTRAVETN